MSVRDEKRFAAALADYRAGRLLEAAAGFRRVLVYTPRHAGALYMLGTLELAARRMEEAAALLRRAVASKPDYAPAWTNLGVALVATGQHEQASVAYHTAIRIDPTSGTAFVGLSAALLMSGRAEKALEAASEAVRLQPQSATAHANAGAALVLLNRADEAEAAFKAALSRDGTHGDSLRGLAELRRSTGRDLASVADLLERASQTNPGPGALVELAEFHRGAGDVAAAAQALRRAAARYRDDPLVRLATAMAPLSAVHMDEPSRLQAVSAYTRTLEQLDAWARTGGPARLASLADVLGRAQPFFLPYAADDILTLQQCYGRLAADASMARYGDAALSTSPPAEGERVRLGVVSAHVREHSVWKVPLRGWLDGLDRRLFNITLYHVGNSSDAVTVAAGQLVDKVHHGPRSTAAWRDLILSDRPHVLIHAEVGMSGAAFRLAAMRLAPRQCVGPGHPVTTGLPTMDLFLSSDAMEPFDGNAQYSERLIRLPGLGFPWRPPPSATMPAAVPSLPKGTRFFCAQSPFKYRPEDDALLVAIARAVPDARFIFIAGAGEAGGRLGERLGQAFTAAGLVWSNHGHVVGRVSPAVFAGLARGCDVILDNPSWSGCNSTLEGLSDGTPIVTLAGPTMRSRHTAAILRQVGVTAGIAHDRDDYVGQAVALGLDPARRAAAREQLRAIDMAALDDERTVRGLEAVLRAEITSATPEIICGVQ